LIGRLVIIATTTHAKPLLSKMKRITIYTNITVALLLVLSLSSFKCTTEAGRPVAGNTLLTAWFTEKQFDAFFPMRDKFYTYAAFSQAVKELGQINIKVEKRDISVYKITRINKLTGKATVVRLDPDWNEDWVKKKPYTTYTIDYGKFCAEKDPITNKKELAAFFAHAAHETRHGQNGQYNDGLMYLHEINTSLPYVAENDAYPPVKGKNYYGRGPLQLSFNGNYGSASETIFGDPKILLNNPDLVSTNPVVAFKAAIFFWMTPQSRRPSAHNVITGNWQPTADDKSKGRVPGFGMTTNLINGAIECNQGEGVFSMTDRIGYYQHFLNMLGIKDDNCACSCAKMQPIQ
jgi:hypothetical protein